MAARVAPGPAPPGAAHGPAASAWRPATSAAARRRRPAPPTRPGRPAGLACIAAMTLASRFSRCAFRWAMACAAKPSTWPCAGRMNSMPCVGAGGGERVQRIQVGRHVAVGRIDHRGAAVEDVVAREQQAVFQQHQAQVVGGVAGRVDDLQACAAQPPPSSTSVSPSRQRAVGHELAGMAGRWLPKASPGWAACTAHRACSGRAPGAWSGCEWVQTIIRMSPPAARQSRSMCSGSSGPGSIAR